MRRFLASVRRQGSLIAIAGALALGFLIFPAWLVLIELVLGVSLWKFMDAHSGTKSWKFPEGMFWVLVVLLTASRVFPFLFSSAPLGYDTGIYRYEIWSSFQALPGYVSQLFLGLPLLTNVFQLFGGSLDGAMSWLYVGMVLLVPLSLLMLSERRWGRQTTIMVVLLMLISLIQWKAYTMVLYKQMLALALSFFSLFLFEKRTWLVLIPLLFLALLQPLDVLLVGLSYGLYGGISSFSSREERSFFFSFLIGGGMLMVSLLWLDQGFWSHAWDLFSRGILYPEVLEKSLQSGVFLSLYDYGYQSAFLFVFGMMGLVLDWQVQRRFSLLAWYFFVLFGWIAFGLFFYERLLIHLDAVLLLFAAFALFTFSQSFAGDRWGKVLFVGVCVGLFLPMALVMGRFRPAVSASELEKIQQFCQMMPEGAYVAATDSFYGPWLRGYCLDQRVFGPGLFVDNRWSYPDWQAFWAGDQKAIPELLGRYESEVYFYRGEQQFQLEFDSDVFEWVEGGWWRGAGEGL